MKFCFLFLFVATSLYARSDTRCSAPDKFLYWGMKIEAEEQLATQKDKLEDEKRDLEKHRITLKNLESIDPGSLSEGRLKAARRDVKVNEVKVEEEAQAIEEAKHKVEIFKIHCDFCRGVVVPTAKVQENYEKQMSARTAVLKKSLERATIEFDYVDDLYRRYLKLFSEGSVSEHELLRIRYQRMNAGHVVDLAKERIQLAIKAKSEIAGLSRE